MNSSASRELRLCEPRRQTKLAEASAELLSIDGDVAVAVAHVGRLDGRDRELGSDAALEEKRCFGRCGVDADAHDRRAVITGVDRASVK